MMIGLLMVIAMQTGPRPDAAIRTIERGQTSRVGSAREVVARTPQEWAGLWHAHAPERPVPDVDFSRETVVAVFLGSRPTAGYSVEIVGVKEGVGGLVVQYYETAPRADMIRAQIITDPFHIVAIPKATGNVVFERVER
jgi:hypothetical protein